jgi:hypothetical protein
MIKLHRWIPFLRSAFVFSASLWVTGSFLISKKIAFFNIMCGKLKFSDEIDQKKLLLTQRIKFRTQRASVPISAWGHIARCVQNWVCRGAAGLAQMKHATTRLLFWLEPIHRHKANGALLNGCCECPVSSSHTNYTYLISGPTHSPQTRPFLPQPVKSQL